MQKKAPILLASVFMLIFAHQAFVQAYENYINYTPSEEVTDYTLDATDEEVADYIYYESCEAVTTKISWTFYAYIKPDFTSERRMHFAPQSVDVLYENGDGWGLVQTDFGEYWVYLRANKRHIDSRTGVFEQKDGERYTSIINPQVVTIFEYEENWLKIGTWLGEKWIDINFTPPTDALDNVLGRFGNSISVYFENLETGFVYRHNADRIYFSASVPKATFALYIYQKAENEETCLDNTITYTQADHMGGSGVIRHNHRIGATFTQREVLRLNLSESDNIATNMLRRVHGIEGYRQFIANIGGNPNFVGNRIMNSSLTANEAGLFAREIFRYVESGGKYSAEFRTHLLDNQFPFIVSDYPVASKTGWTRHHAWHDMAIVYAPSPYTLVILTARGGWTAQDYRDFAEISMAFQNFNTTWFAPPHSAQQQEEQLEYTYEGLE